MFVRGRNKVTHRQYGSLEEVRDDIILIFGNCEAYNEGESDLCAEARRLRKLLDKEVAKAQKS